MISNEKQCSLMYSSIPLWTKVRTVGKYPIGELNERSGKWKQGSLQIWRFVIKVAGSKNIYFQAMNFQFLKLSPSTYLCCSMWIHGNSWGQCITLTGDLFFMESQCVKIFWVPLFTLVVPKAEFQLHLLKSILRQETESILLGVLGLMY